MNPAQHTLLVEQLRKGRGVTDTLTALAEDTDTPHDRVRRARLLRELLQELDRGALAIDCLNHRKVSRFLAFLEREIAWLETSQALEPPRPHRHRSQPDTSAGATGIHLGAAPAAPPTTTHEGRTTHVRSHRYPDPGAAPLRCQPPAAADTMSLYIPHGRQLVEKKCPNADCPEHGFTQELPAFEELGRLFLCREEDIYCRECGTEMTDI